MYKNTLLLVLYSLSALYTFPSYGQYRYFLDEVGPLNVSRGNHTTNLLNDGRVLVVGGIHCRTELNESCWSTNSAEVFDLDTLTWSDTNFIGPYLYAHSAVLLPSGKVLVFGGQEYISGGLIKSSYIFDPANDSWNETSECAISSCYGKSNRKGFEISGDSVLIENGLIYNESEQSWSAVDFPEMMVEDGDIKLLTKLEENRFLYISGGMNLAIYDAQSEEFTQAGQLIEERHNFAVTALKDKRILFTGGTSGSHWNDHDSTINTSEIYDLETQTSRLTSKNLSSARKNHRAFGYESGHVVIVGGTNLFGNPIPRIEVFDVSEETWSFDIASPSSFVDGVFLMGGELFTFDSEALYLIPDYSKDRGANLLILDRFAEAGYEAAYGGQITTLENGSYLIIGGYSRYGITLSTSLILHKLEDEETCFPVKKKPREGMVIFCF